ncbi:hypothetical protein FACS189450_14800 [Spirochaetia bacterium]|nr:hypothetical protein FACS189450_14800 [Spirochaetia bacterium]
MAKIKVKLGIENIGPHSGGKSLHSEEEMDSLKAIFYASNGTGKSFISRAFRLLSLEKNGMLSDELLTLGQSSGSLVMGVTNTYEPSKVRKLSINVNRGNTPVITNSTEYLFHVFNSEYVEENIKPRNYTPDGNIDGYILGKVQIDLTDEKKQEVQLKNEIDDKEKEIDSKVQ